MTFASRETRFSLLLARLGLVLFGIALALASGEGLARLVWKVPPAEPPRNLPPDLPELSTAVELMQPNVNGTYNGAIYRTNSHGFRGPEIPIEKPPGVFRIVLAGDSVTMGSGVAEEETYAALLEQALNARHPGVRYEALNVGVIGLNIHQVMSRLAHTGMPFAPDLIIYGWTINDIKGPHYRKSYIPLYGTALQARYFDLERSRSYLLRLVGPRYLSFRDLLWPARGTYLFELDDNYFHNPPAWSDFKAGLDRLAEIAAQHDIPAVVFLHTSLEYLNLFHPYRRIYDLVAGAAAERGLATVRSLDVMLGQDEVSLSVARYDPHPNAAGHRLLARALVDGLDRLPRRFVEPAARTGSHE